MIPDTAKATVRQIAYARRVFGAEGISKKQIAIDVGYSPGTKIENIESEQGFKNAIAVLAEDSHNLILSVMAEMKARGMEDFSNKELTSALTAITNAWEKFGKANSRYDNPNPANSGKNRLRTVILQNINNTNIPPIDEEKIIDVEEEMGF